MRTIIGLAPLRGGTIEVFGHDLERWTPERQDIARRWGVLFQHGALFSSLTVKQNIQVPMREYLDFSPHLSTRWRCSSSLWSACRPMRPTSSRRSCRAA